MTKYEEYSQKQTELNNMKIEMQVAFKAEYLAKKDELAKMEAEYKKLYGENIDNANKLSVEDLEAFIEIINENPEIEVKDLRNTINKHPKTLAKLLKIYNASDHTIDSLKAELKIA